MRNTFRIKLLGIVSITALAFGLLILMNAMMSRRTEQQLDLIADHHIPLLELGPKLKTDCERMRRGLQDAVVAQDLDALEQTHQLRDRCLSTLRAAGSLVPASRAAPLRAALEDYFGAAYDLSRRLIGGETGEPVVEAMATMQAKHRLAMDLLEQVATFDQQKLRQAFTAATAAQATAARVRLLVSAACLTGVLVLSLWMSRGVLRSLSALGAGFVRFGQGDFAVRIRTTDDDEFGRLAAQANQMADNLRRLGEERDLADWLKAGHAGLVLELRGSLEPDVAATRAVSFLTRYLGAPAGALYWLEDAGWLQLLGHHASWLTHEGGAPRVRFRPGEGLLGQSAQEPGITVLNDLPEGFFPIRSGLGGAAPRALVLLPLTYLDKVIGVLELAVLAPWPPAASELLSSVRETLVITIEAARGRAAQRLLLRETQQQAERLAVQEDALRANNDELHTQQLELRAVNEELMRQAVELETQRRWLEQSNGELRETRKNLETQARELSKVSAYKSRFLANMSHELRTPLNSMLLLSNVLADNDDGNLTPRQVEFCKTIYGAGKDLLGLINQVLDLAKVESGKQEVHSQVVRLADLADYARRMFGPLARDKQLTFDVTIAGDALPETIVTDPRRVEQILNNLIGNAIKFTFEGSVTLRIEPGTPAASASARASHEGMIALSVADTGSGIPPEHQARIFAPFEQLDAAPDRRYGGTGLGLSIARELVLLLGGELTLQSSPGKGSTFTCFLPRALPQQTPAEESVSPTEQNPVAVRRLSSAAPPRSASAAIDLLVVEDDPVFAELMADLIAGQGLTCEIASDGTSALRLARERTPSGIVLDVKLADMSGFTVLERLREDARTSAIPVHLVSAVDGAERGLALGAVGFLAKPATRGDLLRVIESLRRSAHESRCRLLIVQGDDGVAGSLGPQLQEEGIETTRVTSTEAALTLLAKESFSCMVLDLGTTDTDELASLQMLEQTRGAALPPVLVYTARPLSKAEVKRLEAYAAAVVMKEGPATERLLEEVRLFARRRANGLPARHKLLPPVGGSPVQLEGRKILIADDDMRTVYALSALLRAKGVEVLVADTGHAALSVLEQNTDVELVLMDIVMPEMDGFEAMRRIREQDRLRDLPVIALTAKSMRTDREQCIAAGATDYVPKPFDEDRLLMMIQQRLVPKAAA